MTSLLEMPQHKPFALIKGDSSKQALAVGVNETRKEAYSKTPELHVFVFYWHLL